MKANVVAVYFGSIVTITFDDDDTAKLAYEKINAALREYKMFKNDRVEVVEVENATGLSALKLERMDAVLLNKAECFDEAAWRQNLADEKRVRDLREEFGLPPLIMRQPRKDSQIT